MEREWSLDIVHMKAHQVLYHVGQARKKKCAQGEDQPSPVAKTNLIAYVAKSGESRVTWFMDKDAKPFVFHYFTAQDSEVQGLCS